MRRHKCRTSADLIKKVRNSFSDGEVAAASLLQFLWPRERSRCGSHNKQIGGAKYLLWQKLCDSLDLSNRHD
jgi:hypothetical protein